MFRILLLFFGSFVFFLTTGTAHAAPSISIVTEEPTQNQEVEFKMTGCDKLWGSFNWIRLTGENPSETGDSATIENSDKGEIEFTKSDFEAARYEMTGACYDTPNDPNYTETSKLQFTVLDENGALPESVPTPLPPGPPCSNEIEAKDGKCRAVDTALGRISTSPESFVGNIFALLLSLSGGIAVLLIIRAGYQLMTSQGNHEKVQEAREIITSAIVGLLFLIFSFIILTVIGVDILHLPGFGG